MYREQLLFICSGCGSGKTRTIELKYSSYRSGLFKTTQRVRSKMVKPNHGDRRNWLEERAEHLIQSCC